MTMKYLYTILTDREQKFDNLWNGGHMALMTISEQDFEKMNARQFEKLAKQSASSIFDAIEDIFWAKNTPYKSRGEFFEHIKKCEKCDIHIQAAEKVWGFKIET